MTINIPTFSDLSSTTQKKSNGLQSVLKTPNISTYLDKLYNDYFPSTSNRYRLIINDQNIKGDLQTLFGDSSAGFEFDILNEVNLSRESESADYVAENSQVITDEIILKPLEVRLSGLQGLAENIYKPSPLVNGLARISKKLNILNNYLPSLTQEGLQLFNEVASKTLQATSYLDGIIGSTKSFFDFLYENSPGGDNISKSIQLLYLFQELKTTFSLNTPKGLLGNNFIITSISNITINPTYDSTADISITIREIRTVNTIIKKKEKRKNAKISEAGQIKTNSGSTNGKTTQKDISFIKQQYLKGSL